MFPNKSKARGGTRLAAALLLPAAALAQDAKSPLTLGDNARAQHDYQAALADYAEAIAQNPQDTRAYILRGMVRAKLGDNDGAIADDETALQLDPKSAVAHTNLANAAAAENELAAARDNYTAAIALDPGRAAAYLGRANVEAMQQNFTAALPDYNAALALEPGNAIALYDRAGARRAVGKYDGAVSDYSQVLLHDPKDVRAQMNRAVIRMAQRKWATAASDLQACLREVPPDQQIYLRLYLWVIGVKQGGAPAATRELLAYLGSSSPKFAATWPWEMANFCAHDGPADHLLADAAQAQSRHDRGQHAQACYYAGLKSALTGDAAHARTFFEECVSEGNPRLHEVILAREELKAGGHSP